MIMVFHNIRSPERCFSLKMGGEVDLLLQLFFQVCSVGFQREKQASFGLEVLTADANTGLLRGAGMFDHTGIQKGSKYRRFCAFPPSTNTCGIGFHLDRGCLCSVLLFLSFCDLSWQSQISLSILQLAFSPFRSPWWYTFICSLVFGLASVRISFVCFLSRWCFFKYLCMPVLQHTQGVFILMKAFLYKRVQSVKWIAEGNDPQTSDTFFFYLFKDFPQIKLNHNPPF